MTTTVVCDGVVIGIMYDVHAFYLPIVRTIQYNDAYF
jgi:hypothetical protein